MEIIYDEHHNVTFRLDDGREFGLTELLADLERFEKLETALTLTTTSREWNRKRVVELEGELERLGQRSNYPSALDWAAVRAERDRLKDLVQEERIRGNNLSQRLAQSEQRERELEAQNQRLTDYANAQEARHAEVNEEHRQSIAARDALLQGAAATVRRVQNVVWTADLDRLIENRGVAAVVHELADLSAATVSRVRAFVGQP